MAHSLNEGHRANTRRGALQALSGLSLMALQGCGGQGAEAVPDGERLDLGLPAAPSPWQRELQSLIDLLLAYHPRPFFAMPRERFVEQASALMLTLGTAAEERAYLGLMRLLSSLRDGHCFINFPWTLEVGACAMPISVYAFEEGIFVTHVDPSRPELSLLPGAEVLEYGARPAAQALQAAAAVLPAENGLMALHYGAQALRSGLVLADAGLADSPRQVRMRLRRRDGALADLMLATGALTELQPSYTAPPARPFRQSALDFWAEWLGDSVFYLRYRRCRDAAGFESLIREHLSLPRFPAVRKVVVDLRGNGGGDSRVIRPLVEGLQMLNVQGSRIAILSDRGTMSAAVDGLLDLKALGGLHAGEAPGQRPNFNGNVRSIPTASGRLTLQVPTTYQPRVPGDPDQLIPDLQRPRRHAEWLEQRDPLVDEVLLL